jgi:hypothetical protein
MQVRERERQTDRERERERERDRDRDRDRQRDRQRESVCVCVIRCEGSQPLKRSSSISPCKYLYFHRVPNPLTKPSLSPL